MRAEKPLSSVLFYELTSACGKKFALFGIDSAKDQSLREAVYVRRTIELLNRDGDLGSLEERSWLLYTMFSRVSAVLVFAAFETP